MKKTLGKLSDLACQIKERFEKWDYLYRHGCSDPSWPDGINLNLVRNHILYRKAQIAELCEEEDLALPKEYFLPLPPEVDPHLFIDPTSERAKRLSSTYGFKAAVSKTIFDDRQMALF